MSLRLATLLTLSILTGGFAAGSVRAEDKGTFVVTPTQPAPMRTAPPTGLLRMPGEQFGQTEPGTSYLVLDRIDVQSGLGSMQTWVELAPIDQSSGQTDMQQTGWVYYGRGEAFTTDVSPNFATRSLNQLEPAVRSIVIDQIEETR